MDSESTQGANESIDSGNQSAPEPSWWYDERTPGSGERPDFLPTKFKSMADAVKSYNELEKRVGSAPSQYDFSAGSKWLDPDYEPFQQAAEYAKSRHVPQDVFSKILEATTKYLDELAPDVTAEREALGENAEERLQVLNNWAKSNFSEETYAALTGNMRTADAVKAIEEVRNKMLDNNTTIPNGNDAGHSNSDSLEDVQAELNTNLDKYKSDPKYRREIQMRLEKAAKNTNFVDKPIYGN